VCLDCKLLCDMRYLSKTVLQSDNFNANAEWFFSRAARNLFFCTYLVCMMLSLR
jgi:hypothetical protein